MSAYSRLALVFGLILILAGLAVGTAWAVPDNPYVSDLKLTIIRPYSNQLTATVTTNPNGTYHYAYELIFAAATVPGQALTSFSVSNTWNLPFTNQWCDHDFTAAVSSDSIYWYLEVPLGSTVNFSYDSPMPYGVVEAVMQAGLPADGLTLGMVPEPSTVASLVLGLCGTMWVGFKRRSR